MKWLADLRLKAQLFHEKGGKEVGRMREKGHKIVTLGRFPREGGVEESV